MDFNVYTDQVESIDSKLCIKSLSQIELMCPKVTVYSSSETRTLVTNDTDSAFGRDCVSGLNQAHGTQNLLNRMLIFVPVCVQCSLCQFYTCIIHLLLVDALKNMGLNFANATDRSIWGICTFKNVNLWGLPKGP